MADNASDKWNAALTVRYALKNDPEAAREILRGFVEATELTDERDWPVQFPWIWVRYLAKAFRAILDSQTDAERALHLKAARSGRPKGARTHDEVRIAAAYWLLRRRGQTPERANKLLGQATGADRTTIQRAALGSCSVFEDSALYDDRLLESITFEQPSLAVLFPLL